MKKNVYDWWLSGYVPVNSEVTAWINAGIADGDVRISDRIAQATDIAISSFKSTGLWDQFDVCWNAALANPTLNHYKKLNIKNPSVCKHTYFGTVSSTDVGVNADGTSSYIDTNFNPATQGVKYTQNSACRIIYMYAPPSVGIRVDGIGASSANAMAVVQTANVGQRINQDIQNLNVGAIVSGNGYQAINRSDGSNVQVYNRKIRQNATRASAALTNANQLIGRSSGLYGNGTYSWYIMGASLTETQHNQAHDILEQYFVDAGLRAPYVYTFLTMGQSNDASEEDTTRFIGLTPYTQTVNPYQHIFRKVTYNTTNDGAFQELTMGTNNYGASGVATATGMEVVIGKKMADKKLDHVYIKASLGGTGLDPTTPVSVFNWYPTTPNQCFQIATQSMYLPALSASQARWPGKTIKPVLIWHQGEKDEAVAGAPANYLSNFTTFMSSLRAVDSTLATAPLICIKLYWSPGANEDTINNALQTYCANNANCYFIDVVPTVLAGATSQRPYMQPYIQKSSLPAGIKSTYPTATADDSHWSCFAHSAKGELIMEKLEEIGYFN